MNHLFSFLPLRKLRAHCQLVGILEAPLKSPALLDLASFQSPLRTFAQKHRLPWSLRMRDGSPATEFLKSLNADVLVVSAFSELLTSAELAATRWGGINLHPSLLPHYRGPHPLFWQARHFHLDGGITVHRIDAGADTGPIFSQKPLKIQIGEDQRSIFSRAGSVGSEMLLETLLQLATTDVTPEPQTAVKDLFYARHPTKADRIPDWMQWTLEHAWHFLRVTQDDFRCIPMDPPLQGRWQILSMHPQQTIQPPGTLLTDRNGTSLVHPDGLIRIRHIPPQNPLRHLLGKWKRRLLDGEI